MAEVYTSGNPPKMCRRGHRLGPHRVLVAFVHCGCGAGGGRGHLTWTCRECGNVSVADGHTDDSQLFAPLPEVSAAMLAALKPD